MEESGLRPRASVSEGPHSCPAPESPSVPALVTSSLAPQPTQKPDPEADLPSTDRSGLAVRLVRKTKTNFLLSSTKKSRKPKAPVPPNEATAPNASGRHGSHSLKDPTSSGLPEEVKKDRKRGHIKSRENPATDKSRKENNSKSKARSSLRKMKSDRSSKGPVIPGAYSGSNKGLPLKPVFGVRLSLAYERSPSHDGVPLPAFFRHCIDYVEQYGLSSEGIYRVPGVNSQIQSLVLALDRGEDFLQIPPTSPTYYQSLEGAKHPTGSRGIQCITDTASKSKSHMEHISRSSAPSPKRNRSIAADGRPSSVPFTAQPQPPHDLSVICSVVKYFLRSLPEPVLTASLGAVMESLPTDSRTMYESIARLVHQRLPRPHRYLLAWLLQHMVHIIDRAGENLMTQANIIIVLSPCLSISHRLLSILLGPPPLDVRIDLNVIDPSLPQIDPEHIDVDPSTWHWLFPHPIYLLRPYRPPLRPGPDLELPETNEELELELHKQESLLYHLHEEIGRGDTSAEKEAFLWEVQRLVTEIRRRKQLVDPDAIRAELSRQQAQLDRLHRAIAQNSTEMGADFVPPASHTDCSQPTSGTSGSDSGPTHRRRLVGSAKPRTEPVSLYTDELWEVQRQVTMLKRRLKQQEKLASVTPSTGAPVGTTTIVNSATRSDVIVRPFGGVPLIIPTLSELDEEEVLNLTLRKLPLEPLTSDVPSESSFPVPTSSSSVAPSQCVPLTCSATTTTAAILATTVCALSDTSSIPGGDNGPPLEPPAQPVIPAPVESDVSASLIVEKVSTNDQVDTAVLSDSPPSTPPPPPPVSVFPPIPPSPTLEDFPELLRKPDLEVSTSLQLDSVTKSTSVTVKEIDLQRAAKPEHPFVNSSLSSLPTDVCFKSVTVCPDFVASESALINGNVQTEKLESAGRNALYQIALYEARKLELNAIQADLRARIRSEQAEISQIQSQIRHLLETGGSRVRRLYESEFVSVARYMKPNDVISVPSSMEQSSGWLARSWTRIADLLNSESGGHLSDEPEACLMDDDSDESSESACHLSGDERSRPHLLSDSIANGSGRERSDSKSRKPGSVSYVILVDQDEEKRSNANRPGVVGDRLDVAERSLDVFSDSKLTNDERFRRPTTEQNALADASIVPSGAHNGDDQEEEDDDEDEDDEEDEMELARTLHQLTLDNARLVQLNARYLEGIQAERNRCAELKVLLKMRTIRGNSVSFQLKESPA